MQTYTATELMRTEVINPAFIVKRADVEKAKAKIEADGFDAKFRTARIFYTALTVQTAARELGQ